MADYSVFDKLTSQLTELEKNEMLDKIEANLSISNEVLHEYPDDLNAITVDLEEEYSKIDFLSKIIIFITSIFKSKNKLDVTQDLLVERLKKSVTKKSKGLYSHTSNTISGVLATLINQLEKSLLVYRDPLSIVTGLGKTDFYAFLGRMELRDIEETLWDDTDPQKISQEISNPTIRMIKDNIDQAFDITFRMIGTEIRQNMKLECSLLSQLTDLSHFPFDSILRHFNSNGHGGFEPAEIDKISEPLLNLADFLYSIKHPPSIKLLESLFLFYYKDSFIQEDFNLEESLVKSISNAEDFKNILRKLNHLIPVTDFVKILSKKLNYVPTNLGGGEDWFHTYKKFWEKRVSDRYYLFVKKDKINKLQKELKTSWELDTIPSTPGYNKREIGVDVNLKYKNSLSAVNTFINKIFYDDFHDTLNLIYLQGKFVKEENKNDYCECFRKMESFRKQIDNFISKCRVGGIFHSEMNLALKEATSMEHQIAIQQQIIDKTDTAAKEIISAFLVWINLMSKILKGIHSEDKGDFDSLHNLAVIGGRHNSEFKIKLFLAESQFTNAYKIILDIFSLEERDK